MKHFADECRTKARYDLLCLGHCEDEALQCALFTDSGIRKSKKYRRNLTWQYYWPHRATDVYILAEKCLESQKTVNWPCLEGAKAIPSDEIFWVFRDKETMYSSEVKARESVFCNPEGLVFDIDESTPINKDGHFAHGVHPIVLQNLMLPCGVPLYLLTNNACNLRSSCPLASVKIWGPNRWTSQRIIRTPTKKTERHNQTRVAIANQYENEDQTNCDSFVEPVLYACSCEVHRTTRTTLFSIASSWQPLGSVELFYTVPLINITLNRWQDGIWRTKQCSGWAQVLCRQARKRTWREHNTHGSLIMSRTLPSAQNRRQGVCTKPIKSGITDYLCVPSRRLITKKGRVLPGQPRPFLHRRRSRGRYFKTHFKHPDFDGRKG